MTGNLGIEIDFRSGMPIYIQIMDQIKHMIAVGLLKPGDQLPTVRQMATDLRINFNTVARSYKLLDEEGIISTQHGRGTYILDLPSEENGNKLRFEDLQRLAANLLLEAEKLGFEPDEVKEVFNKKLTIWQKTGVPPLPDVED